MMKRILASTAVLVFCALPLAAQGHAMTAGDEMTITGQVVDLNCNTTNGASGSGHRAWAQACAKAGVPLGLLSSDGTMYLPVSSKPGDPQNSKLIPFAESKVKVTGTHRLVTFTLLSAKGMSFEFCGSPGFELTGKYMELE